MVILFYKLTKIDEFLIIIDLSRWFTTCQSFIVAYFLGMKYMALVMHHHDNSILVTCGTLYFLCNYGLENIKINTFMPEQIAWYFATDNFECIF